MKWVEGKMKLVERKEGLIDLRSAGQPDESCQDRSWR